MWNGHQASQCPPPSPGLPNGFSPLPWLPKSSAAVPYHDGSVIRSPALMMQPFSQHPWAQNPLFTGVPFGLHTGYPPPSTRAPLSTPGGQGVSVCTLALVKGRVQIRTIHFQKLDQRAVQSRVPSKGRSISSETTASFAWPWRASPLRSKFGESPFLFSANVAPIKQCEMTAVLREMVSQEREICY